MSLPPELLSEARRAVAAGAAESLSTLVEKALRTQLSRTHALAELERVLGGKPPQDVLNTARRDLGLPHS